MLELGHLRLSSSQRASLIKESRTFVHGEQGLQGQSRKSMDEITTSPWSIQVFLSKMTKPARLAEVLTGFATVIEQVRIC